MVESEPTDRDGVRRALAGIDIAFLGLGSSLQQVEVEQGFIDVDAETSLPHLVELSAAGAPSDGVASVLRWRAAIESHIAASGVPSRRQSGVRLISCRYISLVATRYRGRKNP